MRSIITPKKATYIFFPSGIILSVALLLNIIPQNSVNNNINPTIENNVVISDVVPVVKQMISIGSPVRLEIPAININTNIISVGLTPTGAVAVPDNPFEVAWYNLGSKPGETGSAVIDGHYGWINNEPAVFDDLNKLKTGDEIFVEDKNGRIINFKVREIAIFKKDDDAVNVFLSNDGKAHLNLITCTGDWNKSEKTFSERLVIFSDVAE
ncbi:hypothetical protein COY25_01715 [Candidatus Uhrbacteria bacterium CG_4_10_14_0_2_um_filter_41_7]|uniref:Class F sortase n=1 Tax=Candidatus Uhrbacteria bacterium CG_4_9_14_3_um_filter_41_35 TaxID=1975034 RepID=A0A2M7XFR2_9BACT|nr:MAG: hypothetical protein COV92_00830 [Candidatus Uhrbacteria bacterium CG11_big_fil_rev_8_21_14_0_20_41_9]PIZ54826.1 MAG: hypothetical protein COY25_01715 [Candidatus Uhrbacteria bacterium CG_4_10_14_0_2_um_filter_41_7]PJA46701.1 MAG: hypothetical protein CO173_02960 [Candidatus Uhrbacteria bacterium CG_4_9_14_3_um_filter_41_35]